MTAAILQSVVTEIDDSTSVRMFDNGLMSVFDRSGNGILITPTGQARLLNTLLAAKAGRENQEAESATTGE